MRLELMRLPTMVSAVLGGLGELSSSSASSGSSILLRRYWLDGSACANGGRWHTHAGQSGSPVRLWTLSRCRSPNQQLQKLVLLHHQIVAIRTPSQHPSPQSNPSQPPVKPRSKPVQTQSNAPVQQLRQLLLLLPQVCHSGNGERAQPAQQRGARQRVVAVRRGQPLRRLAAEVRGR